MSRTGRLESLTGLRFVATLFVFCSHVVPLWANVPNTSWMNRFIFEPGAAGVSFFFVLSGFVLTWGTRHRPALRTFS